MIIELKEKFPDCEISEIAAGIFNVFKDSFSSVIFIRIQQKFLILKRNNMNYDFNVIDNERDALIEIIAYFM